MHINFDSMVVECIHYHVHYIEGTSTSKLVNEIW